MQVKRSYLEIESMVFVVNKAMFALRFCERIGKRKFSFTKWWKDISNTTINQMLPLSTWLS
jgi:hypothetical protein